MRAQLRSGIPVLFEALESRMMLSAAPAAAHPAHHAHHAVVPAVHKPAHHKAPVVVGDPIFMEYGGVTGEVSVKGFAGDIELNSFQWGVGRGISSPTGGSADREASTPSVSEITITKSMDKTSPALLKEALAGQGTTVRIFFVDLIKGPVGTQVYAEYDLSNVLVSGYSVSSGGDRPTESLSLNFTKITYTYFTQNADGTTSPSSTTYDLSLAKVV
jgi:type VI secretion system secreted protein Hcp